MRELKDYLHLYLGCECIIENKLKVVLCGFEQNGHKIYPVIRLANYSTKMVNDFSLIKLLLKPLSSMTEDEAIEITKPIVIYGDIPNAREYETFKNVFGRIVVSWGKSHYEKYVPADEKTFTSTQFQYLLSKHFDLFGLIESGLAIDATTLTP